MQTLIRSMAVTLVTLLAAPAMGGRPTDVPLRHGDLVVVNEGINTGALYRVDPATGDRVVMSQAGVRGEGVSFNKPLWATFTPSGNVLVTDYAAFTTHMGIRGALIEVDRFTGDRRVLSGLGVGSGPEFDNPFGVVALDDAIYVTNQGHGNTLHGALLRIDPVTGDRQTVVDMSTPTGMDRDANGTFWIADPELDGVVGIGPSGTVTATFGGFEHPLDVSAQPDGTLVVGDLFLNGIFRLDPGSGSRTLISGRGRGEGEPVDFPEHVTLGLSGELLVGDPTSGAVWSIDPASGDRTILSGRGVGSGPEFSTVRDVVVVTPEPASVGACGVLVGALALRRKRREGQWNSSD